METRIYESTNEHASFLGQGLLRNEVTDSGKDFKARQRIMISKNILVVGNLFHAFSNGCTCLTLDDLLSLSRKDLQFMQTIVLGQGIGLSDLDRIRSFLDSSGLPKDIHIEEHVSKKISHGLVHKRFEQNVMITLPIQTGEGVFEANLVVDDACAELSDHITGLHIPGMLFVEAARQNFLACVPYLTEKKGIDPKKYIYTLREVEVQYRQFLYPLPINIYTRVRDVRKLGNTGVFSAEVHVRFAQLGKIGVEVISKARGFEKSIMEKLEETDAAKQVGELLVIRHDDTFRQTEPVGF